MVREATNQGVVTQPEIYTQVVPKNKKQARAQQKEKKFWEPSGVKSGSAKGDALVAAVQLTADIVKFNHGRIVDNDFKDAQKQLWAVQHVVDNIQFGLDNNIFAPSDIDNLYDYANYLLDGTKPQMSIKTGYTETGSEIRKQVDDSRKIKKFEQYTNKIEAKRREKLQQAQNTAPTTENN